MADKISTLILNVDLDCNLCYKKIRRTLCKLQEKEHIQSIFYDEKSNTVTISGPFNPQKLTKKLCSRACSVIKDMQIKDNKPKETKPAEEKPKEKPAAEKPKEKPAEPAKDKPKDAKPAEAKTDKPKDAKPAEAKTDKPKDAKPAEAKKDKSDDKPKDAKPAKSDDKPKDAKPAEAKNDKPKDAKPVEVTKNAYLGQVVEVGQTGYQPVWSAGGPGCYCSPWGYYGDYKGCTCGTGRGYGGPAYGWAPEGPQVVVYGGPSYGGGGGGGYQQSYQTMGPPPVVYGGPAYEVGYQNYQTSKFFCEEEDPQASCSIM